jgi:hypothetical protein
MKPRVAWLLYLLWLAVCLLSFSASTLLGFVTVALGIALRLLEVAVGLLRELLSETRLTRLELRAARLSPRETHDRRDP